MDTVGLAQLDLLTSSGIPAAGSTRMRSTCAAHLGCTSPERVVLRRAHHEGPAVVAGTQALRAGLMRRRPTVRLSRRGPGRLREAAREGFRRARLTDAAVHARRRYFVRLTSATSRRGWTPVSSSIRSKTRSRSDPEAKLPSGAREASSLRRVGRVCKYAEARAAVVDSEGAPYLHEPKSRRPLPRLRVRRRHGIVERSMSGPR